MIVEFDFPDPNKDQEFRKFMDKEMTGSYCKMGPTIVLILFPDFKSSLYKKYLQKRPGSTGYPVGLVKGITEIEEAIKGDMNKRSFQSNPVGDDGA